MQRSKSYLYQYFDLNLVIMVSSKLLPGVPKPSAFESVCFASASSRMLLDFEPKLRHCHIDRWLRLLK